MTHAELCAAAEKAVRAVFADTSVSQQQTLDSLDAIKVEIVDCIDQIEADLRRAE